MLPSDFYARPALDLAVALLGCELVHQTAEGVTAGVIVETEAYRADDPASHSFRGPNARNAVMFGPAGHAYVYLSYGIHYCFNVVGGEDGGAEAVLIRALQPTRGLALMAARRGVTEPRALCSGPAKLVQALGLSLADNGASLTTSELYIKPGQIKGVHEGGTEIPLESQYQAVEPIMVGPRIGITKAADQPWRFFIANNRFVTSHRFNNQAVPLKHDSSRAD